jgi:predicted dinucleotide-binding enzyme
MKIAVLGTGTVGRTIAARLAEIGHDVTIGTRKPDDTMAASASVHTGSSTFSDWQQVHPSVRLATFADAAQNGIIVVNATSGANSLAVLTSAGEANLSGKVLIDVANPLDFSGGAASLSVSNTDSLAEQIQRAYPSTKVVKTLNTLNAVLMVRPAQLANGDHTIFVCGNDAAAKATVIGLLESFGWKDILDLGDITAARGAEMWLPLWLRLMRALGTPAFNLKIVRA